MSPIYFKISLFSFNDMKYVFLINDFCLFIESNKLKIDKYSFFIKF